MDKASLKKILDEALASTEILPGDESSYELMDPRNILSAGFKKMGMDIIPQISVADRKRYMDEMLNPQNMALSMGPSNLVKRIIQVPKLDKSLSTRISKAFDDMSHSPEDPIVKKAYQALIDETKLQYEDLLKKGLKVDKIKNENPYKTSKDLHNLVEKNNEIFYYPTTDGFGTVNKITDNPMLSPTGFKNASGEEMLANDLFRVVHDYYGHVKPRSSFGPIGEEIAYQNHKLMFSPEAQKALATETRGQNSFVNFGKNAEFNKANPSQTIYADQKIGLLPDWAINENSAKVVDSPNYQKLTNFLNAIKNKEDK